MDDLTERHHTAAEVLHMCSKVTGVQRAYCVEHMNGFSGFPEEFVQGSTKEPGRSLLDAEPFTEAQWWVIIFDHVVTPSISMVNRPL